MQQSVGWKPMFPGDDPRCDAGGCQKVVLTERQALVMPAGMIHMVEMHPESVALAANFTHRGLTPADGCQCFSRKSSLAAATLLFRFWSE